MGAFCGLLAGDPSAQFSSSGAVRSSGPRSDKSVSPYYAEALKNLEIFMDRGGALADSASMVRTAYRSLIATVITPPKAILYAPTDRFAVWRKLKAKHFSPKGRNMLWQISHNILPTATFLYDRKVIKDARCAVCKTHPKLTTPFLRLPD
jgi:hypothetical protein